MKLASVTYQQQTRLGAIVEDGRSIALFDAVHSDMATLIESGVGLQSLVAHAHRVSVDHVTVRAPIPRPRRNIICVGKNYRDHAREFARSGFEAGAVQGKDVDDYPALFTKLPDCVIGANDTIELHAGVTSKVDYEAELAVVIGRGGRGISRTAAYEHVFGYTILNDITARDLQKNHKQWFLGKSLDTFAPMGPFLVTADELDPENLNLRCHVNGQLRQDANTRDLVFDIPTLIATISAGTTLRPGDIIATGTPAGVGIGQEPPVFLQPGDRIEISISGIGSLTNTCV